MSDQLDLFTPAARLTDPRTSHEAAAVVGPRAQRDRDRVLDALRIFGALTDFELALAINSQQTSCGVRRGELVRAGLVRAPTINGVKVRRPSPTGSPAQVWELVPCSTTI